jgi:hypothetical protein
LNGLPKDKPLCENHYLLPAFANATSTTKISIKVRHGTVYHAVYRYKTEKTIRENLSSFNLRQQLMTLFERKHIDEEDKHLAQNMLNMLIVVSRLDIDFPDIEIDDVREKLEERYHEDGMDALLKDLKIPTDVKMSEGHVRICSKIEENLRVQFVSGRGKKLLDDRIKVRNDLWNRMCGDDKDILCVLEECILYAPADALESLELVDAPGVGTMCPMEQMQLKEVLRTADAVLVVMQKNLADTTNLEEYIIESKMLDRIIKKESLKEKEEVGKGGREEIKCSHFTFYQRWMRKQISEHCKVRRD